jgi:hypothetical protein
MDYSPAQTPTLTSNVPVRGSPENILAFPASQIKILVGVHFIFLAVILILVGLMYYNSVKQQQYQAPRAFQVPGMQQPSSAHLLAPSAAAAPGPGGAAGGPPATPKPIPK